MNGKPDFALVAHQESWESMAAFFQLLRGPDLPRVPLEEIRSLAGFLPPRPVARIRANSSRLGTSVEGVYIETFITPDELSQDLRDVMSRKVLQGIEIARREGARVAALGGFTSIALGPRLEELQRASDLPLTTGHSLTAAFIVKGLEEAAKIHGKDLGRSRLLVAGATGDLGWSVVRYFSGKVKELLLVARNPQRLEEQERYLRSEDIPCRSSLRLETLLPEADLVVFVTSVPAPSFLLDSCQPDVVICDAGYPKNTRGTGGTPLQGRIFSGGMGRVGGGVELRPDLTTSSYECPSPGVGHGCLLEGVLLALEGRFESYSSGRLGTDPVRIEEIWRIAGLHGFQLAPFFNQAGLWERQAEPALG
jgi:predicted amino acid dehydrogenase